MLAASAVVELKLELGDWDAMVKTSASKSLSIAIAIVLVSAIGFFLVGGKQSGNAQADKGVTTETTAAAAGAQVIPSEPQLRVEPK